MDLEDVLGLEAGDFEGVEEDSESDAEEKDKPLVLPQRKPLVPTALIGSSAAPSSGSSSGAVPVKGRSEVFETVENFNSGQVSQLEVAVDGLSVAAVEVLYWPD